MSEENERITSIIDEAEIIANIGDIQKNIYTYKFAIRLTQLMEENSMTPKVLAMECGIKPNTISKYRHGKGEPQVTEFAKMAKALKVSSDYLCGLSEFKGSDINDYNISRKTGLSYEAIEVLKEYNLKYHNYIPTINFLLEQETLPLIVEKISGIKDISNAKYKEFERKLNNKAYVPIIDTIHQYFTTNSQNETLSINNSSIIVNDKKTNLTNVITSKKNIYTKRTINDEELINYVFLENIKNELKRAKLKYISQFPSEVDNQ